MVNQLKNQNFVIKCYLVLLRVKCKIILMITEILNQSKKVKLKMSFLYVLCSNIKLGFIIFIHFRNINPENSLLFYFL